MRWEEHIKDLYGDNERNEHFKIRTNSEGPQILKGEVEYAMKVLKKGNLQSLTESTENCLKHWKSSGVDHITKILNNIY